MNKIKVLVGAGIAFPDAVKAALGTSVREFARFHGIQETSVSGLINGSTPYRCERERNALAQTLEVERDWLDEQIAQVAEAHRGEHPASVP